MSLTEDVRKLMSPTDEDGRINILYADSYYRMSLEKRYGKAAVDRECNRLNRRAALEYYLYDSKQKDEKRSDKEEVEVLKSRVRRLEKDVKWLKKVVRQLVNSDNSTDGK